MYQLVHNMENRGAYVARPLEFDRQDALQAAMQLFWRQGYSATSLNQLLEAMDIGRSSFYAAFDDKRSLFVEALDLFSERTRRILREPAQVEPAAQVYDFFQNTLFDVSLRRSRRGCMMVNTVLELADVDDGLSELATRHLKRIEADFERLLRQCDPALLSPLEGARYLMLVNQGLRVAARQGRSRRELAGMFNDAIALLGLPAAA
jgi:TetR/AcrR family transcriptional repressor of nem operon